MGHFSPLIVLVPKAAKSCIRLIAFLRFLVDERTNQDLRDEKLGTVPAQWGGGMLGFFRR